jgi:hypothetical protein
VVGERERAAPEQGAAYLNMMMPSMKVAQRAAPDPAHRWSLLGGGAGSLAPLAVVVEEGPPCARQRPTPPRCRRGPRRPRSPRWPPRGPVRETERDRERAREDKDGPRPRVGIKPHPRGDKGGKFFLPSAWWVQNFRRLLVSADVGSRYQKSYINRYQKSLLIYVISYTYQPI